MSDIRRHVAPLPKRYSGVSQLLFVGLGLGLCLVIAVGVGLRLLASLVDNALDAKFRAQMDQTISPTPQLALLKTTSADGWSFGRCTLPRPLSAAEAILPKEDQGERSFRDAVVRSFGGDISGPLADTAEFLQCVAGREASRLCDAEVRTAFAVDIAASTESTPCCRH